MCHHLRRLVALGATAAIASLGLMATVAAPASAATTYGPVDPSILDGAPNSLRDIVNNQVADGDTVLLQAGATYVLDDCEGDGYLYSTADITVHGNGATIRQTCDRVVWAPQADLTIDHVIITGGHDVTNEYDGGAFHSDGDELIIRDSSLVGNASCGDGGGITFDSDGTLIVENTTIANNSAERGGAIASHAESDATHRVTNSTITNNSADEGGGLFIHDGANVALVYTTLVANTTDATPIECEEEPAPAPASAHHVHGDVSAQANGSAANIEFAYQSSVLTTFASVIASPVEGPNCNIETEDEFAASSVLTTTVSNGYNYSDDASCGLTGTGDRQSASNPNLGALAANGGTSQTRLPLAGSPLIDGVPLASCQADGAAGITTDQRGVTRPQGAGCDIGAVEVVFIAPAADVVLVPRFTG